MPSVPTGDSTVQAALLAMQREDFDVAYAIWQSLARRGDDKAAVEAGLMHHLGQGMPVDYNKAMDWYLEAFDRNGDAFNNIGVMHRDGLGVPRNRKIAYLLFLTVHMMGLGSEETVMRANQNLRGEIAELPLEDRHEALCYTLPYVEAYVKSKGALDGIPPHLRASSERQRIRDLRWWTPGEVGEFQCPPGT